MRAFAQKSRQTQQTKPVQPTTCVRACFGQIHAVRSVPYLQRTLGYQAIKKLFYTNTEELEVKSGTSEKTRFAHHFSRIPVHDQVPIVAKSRLSTQLATTQLRSASDIYESMNKVQAPPFPEVSSSSSSPPPAETNNCVQPNSVRLVSSHPVGLIGHLTGGGICAVMEALPRRNLCSNTIIVEQVALAPGATCPNSLLRPNLCSGGSLFFPGRPGSPTQACPSVNVPATGFFDQHRAHVMSTSVLHDTTRNPQNLNSCSFTCNQRYFTQTSGVERTLGRFQIRYDLARDTNLGRDVTTVRATKTQSP